MGTQTDTRLVERSWLRRWLFAFLTAIIDRSKKRRMDTPGPEEFAEIESCGGTYKLIKQPDGVAMSISFTGTGAGLLQMGIGLDGQHLEFWPSLGIDQRPRQEPAPMVPAFLPTDRLGLYGRQCPDCHTYFRTNGIAQVMQCPYCGIRAPMEAFTTKNQADFLNRQRELWNTGFHGADDITIDLDQIARELPQNRPNWVPREQAQKFLFRCEKCDSTTDILGEYGACPRCGYRNSLSVLKKHLEVLDQEFKQAEAELKDKFERGQKWLSLVPRYVSGFEAMAGDIHSQLLRLPMVPKRREEVERISFQQIRPANEALQKWFAIDIFAGLKHDDQTFLNREFNRRHLIVHKGGNMKIGPGSMAPSDEFRSVSANSGSLANRVNQF
jgi:DNA-directed RNA polymerase subunit RPC12/RpoP